MINTDQLQKKLDDARICTIRVLNCYQDDIDMYSAELTDELLKLKKDIDIYLKKRL